LSNQHCCHPRQRLEGNDRTYQPAGRGRRRADLCGSRPPIFPAITALAYALGMTL
jgi:hypothetical protein